MPSIVGVDFDNTVVSYDNIMYKVALQEGFITAGVNKDKKNIRDQIRQLPEGEKKWRKIQAIVYGEAMGDAVLIDGVKQFFKACKVHNITAYIISHKGEFAAAGERNINLRDSALQWMIDNKFFDADGLGLSRDHVFFESTRLAKIERIKNVGCTHFIDDLEETFFEDKFPKDIKKILFAPHAREQAVKKIKIFNNWEKINEYIFS